MLSIGVRGRCIFFFEVESVRPSFQGGEGGAFEER